MRTVGGHMTLVSAVCWIWFGSGLAAQSPAPTPGVVLTDPTRGNLRMLLDKSGLGSSKVIPAQPSAQDRRVGLSHQLALQHTRFARAALKAGL